MLLLYSIMLKYKLHIMVTTRVKLGKMLRYIRDIYASDEYFIEVH